MTGGVPPISGGMLPAGFYPDPENPAQERGWDGGAWTTHVRPRPVAAAPIAPTTPAIMPAPTPLPTQQPPGVPAPAYAAAPPPGQQAPASSPPSVAPRLPYPFAAPTAAPAGTASPPPAGPASPVPSPQPPYPAPSYSSPAPSYSAPAPGRLPGGFAGMPVGNAGFADLTAELDAQAAARIQAEAQADARAAAAARGAERPSGARRRVLRNLYGRADNRLARYALLLAALGLILFAAVVLLARTAVVPEYIPYVITGGGALLVVALVLSLVALIVPGYKRGQAAVALAVAVVAGIGAPLAEPGSFGAFGTAVRAYPGGLISFLQGDTCPAGVPGYVVRALGARAGEDARLSATVAAVSDAPVEFQNYSVGACVVAISGTAVVPGEDGPVATVVHGIAVVTTRTVDLQQLDGALQAVGYAPGDEAGSWTSGNFVVGQVTDVSAAAADAELLGLLDAAKDLLVKATFVAADAG